MRRLAWTFAARIGDKYQIHLTQPNYALICFIFLFLLVSGVGYDLWLWHFLDFSINFYGIKNKWS